MTKPTIPLVTKKVHVKVGDESYEFTVRVPANENPTVDVNVHSPLRGEPHWRPGDFFLHRSNKDQEFYSYTIQWVDGQRHPRTGKTTTWRTSGEFGLVRNTVRADWYNHTLFFIGMSGGTRVPTGYQCCVVGCTTDHFPAYDDLAEDIEDMFSDPEHDA